MKFMTVVLLVLVQVSSSYPQPTSANLSDVSQLDNWMFYWRNKHWYQIIPVSSDLSWHAMRDSADKLGGHLPTISFQAENNAVAGFVSPNHIFLGATDEGSEGNWSWISGEPWEFTAWKPGHPNPGSPDANFVALDPSDSLWVDTVGAFNDTQILVVEYESFCRENSGNIDCDPEDKVDIADLTGIIDWLFINFTVPCCPAEANVDGDPQQIFDIADLTFLIDHLFITFIPTSACR